MKSFALALLAMGTSAAAAAIDHPEYASLAGMSDEDLAVYERSINVIGAQPLPPPLQDTSFKLIYDKKHPFVKAGKNDQRGMSQCQRPKKALIVATGPCPGLNTLASHGVCYCLVFATGQADCL